MSELGVAEYAVAFAASLVLSLVLTPAAMRLAVRRDLLDPPREDRAHASPVPYLGGLAIVASFSAVVAAATVATRSVAVVRPLAAVLAVGVGLAVLGLVDDLHGVPWEIRLVAEAGAGAVVHLTGGVQLAGPGWVDALITVGWVVGVTNAINLLDNMDGLSAGIAAIASAAFFVIAVLNGQFLVAALSAALAGCALGFLPLNFFPARIYMGDAGSLFLGFLLAVVGVRLRLADTPPIPALFVPVLVLGVAVFDTTLVVVNRLRHGRSPVQGGTDHASHRLVWLGLPVPVAVSVIYVAAGCLGSLAVVLSRVDTATGVLLVGVLAVIAVLLMALLSVVPVYANSRARRSMIRLVREPMERAGDVRAS